MYNVTNKNITLTQYNNAELCVNQYLQDYVLTGTDKLILTVKGNVNSMNVLIKKELTATDYDANNKLYFRFVPSDTQYLQPFHYCYDVALYTHDGVFRTVIDESIFKVVPSVTEYPVI